MHVDDAAYAAGLVEHAGMPQHMAEIYATFGAATRSGVLDVTTDVVERLTGRAPANIRSVLGPEEARWGSSRFRSTCPESRLHCDQEPGNRRPVPRPACSITSRLWQAVTPEPQ